jgi:RNA polymerase sigma-70 factor (ECF subfamily)
MRTEEQTMSGSGREILADAVTVPEERAVSESVEALVHEHARMVFKIAYSVQRQHADAEDVAQEVFLRVLRHGRELDRVRNQKAWVAKIAWRTAVDRVKSREQARKDVTSAIESLYGDYAAMDDVLAEQQRMKLLRAMIGTLPRDLREPLVLSTVQEMSNSDIAEVLAIPEASVRTRMARARTMLRQKLEAISEGRSR